MHDALCGGAVQFADSGSDSGCGVLRLCTGAGDCCTSFGDLCFYKRFNAAVMCAALLLLAHALCGSGIIGHVSVNPPRNVCPFSTGLVIKRRTTLSDSSWWSLDYCRIPIDMTTSLRLLVR